MGPKEKQQKLARRPQKEREKGKDERGGRRRSNRRSRKSKICTQATKRKGAMEE
jgi:hypothetical protein